MPSFLSTTVTMARLTMAISIQGTHQLALRRMSVKVLLGAMKVSTTRSAWERGGCSRGATELMVQTKVQGPGYAKAGNESASDQPEIKPEFGEIVPLERQAAVPKIKPTAPQVEESAIPLLNWTHARARQRRNEWDDLPCAADFAGRHAGLHRVAGRCRVARAQPGAALGGRTQSLRLRGVADG